MKGEEDKKERLNRKDYWLVEGIVVKVIAKCLGDRYCRKKGVVTGVLDKYVATVTMLDSGHKLKLDQAHLETLIPAIDAVTGGHSSSPSKVKNFLRADQT